MIILTLILCIILFKLKKRKNKENQIAPLDPKQVHIEIWERKRPRDYMIEFLDIPKRKKQKRLPKIRNIQTKIRRSRSLPKIRNIQTKIRRSRSLPKKKTFKQTLLEDDYC